MADRKGYGATERTQERHAPVGQMGQRARRVAGGRPNRPCHWRARDNPVSGRRAAHLEPVLRRPHRAPRSGRGVRPGTGASLQAPRAAGCGWTGPRGATAPRRARRVRVDGVAREPACEPPPVPRLTKGPRAATPRHCPTRKIYGMSRVSAPESRESWDPEPYRYPGSDLPGIPRQRKSPRADQHGGCGHSIGARGSTRDLPEMGFRAGPASSTPRCGSALTGAQPLAVASDTGWSLLAFIRFRNLQSFHGLSTAPTPNRYSTCCRERAPHTSGHSNASCIWWKVPDTDCSGVLSQKTCRLWRAISFHHEEPQVTHGMPSKLPAPSTVSQNFCTLIGRQRLRTIIK